MKKYHVVDMLRTYVPESIKKKNLYPNDQPQIFPSARVNKEETSLLRRLQEQTLPDEAPPMGKIHSFSKIAVTFEPEMQF